MKGFARREFQLMLLRRMADFQPHLVEAARFELDASHSEYMAAHNRWQSMLHARRAPRGLDLYRAVLGPPDSERAERVGDVTVTACQWRLPGLWPDLRWEVIVGVGNVVLHGWLVRAAASPVPVLEDPAGLAPWSCVVGDVVARFPQARQADPNISTQWLVTVHCRRRRSGSDHPANTGFRLPDDQARSLAAGAAMPRVACTRQCDGHHQLWFVHGLLQFIK